MAQGDLEMNFYDLAREIGKTKPGNSCTVARLTLMEVGVGPDRIMDNIVSSSYEWQYFVNHMNGNVTFEHLDKPPSDNRRTWVSEDRRHLFEKDENGFYKLKARAKDHRDTRP